ncbi:MAG TPA: polysaccharide lyase family 7 protein [Phycisphaerae bacterium]|nr:polysaccharide lyase family 7 protein [Phycisphaerae bacterium]
MFSCKHNFTWFRGVLALVGIFFSGIALTGCNQAVTTTTPTATTTPVAATTPIAATAPTTAPAPVAAADVHTVGWTPQPLNFKVQFPYNLKESDRYTFSGGIYHLWVYRTDLPLRTHNKTKPRTEMRFPDYTSGWQQFSADVYVPSGTSGVCIMQIHTGDKRPPHMHVGATIMMVFVIDGSLHFYSSKNIIATNIYNRWFHLNVMHNTKNNHIDIYVDGQLSYSTIYRGKARDWYMKCGVYTQRGASPEMQAYFHNVHLWSKED